MKAELAKYFRLYTPLYLYRKIYSIKSNLRNTISQIASSWRLNRDLILNWQQTQDYELRLRQADRQEQNAVVTILYKI